jgi:hypothetical protein
MSALIPRRAGGEDPERAHSELQQRPLSQAEYRALWEVRAAQWRARELAEELFGSVGYMALIGIAGKGHPRGLLHMEVPFESLGASPHRITVHVGGRARSHPHPGAPGVRHGPRKRVKVEFERIAVLGLGVMGGRLSVRWPPMPAHPSSPDGRPTLRSAMRPSRRASFPPRRINGRMPSPTSTWWCWGCHWSRRVSCWVRWGPQPPPTRS